MPKRTDNEETELRAKQAKITAELADLDERRAEVEAESAAVQAKIPELTFKGKSEGDATALEELKAAQDRMLELSALLVGFSWRRDELTGQLVGVNVAIDAWQRQQYLASIGKGEREVVALVDQFLAALVSLTVLKEKIGTACDALGSLKLEAGEVGPAMLAQIREQGRDPREATSQPWNTARTRMGRMVNAYMRLGKYVLPLDTSSAAARAEAARTLAEHGVLTKKQADDYLREAA
jgi:hypothetical protein